MTCKPMLVPLLIVLLPLAGCGRKTDNRSVTEAGPPPGFASIPDRVAVIDLNIVAEEIGARRKITESLKRRELELMGQLDGFRDELVRRADEVKASYGSDLNDQRQTELDQLLSENDSKVALQAQAAQVQLASYHAQLKLKLLNEVRPVAWQVAESHDMSIVMTTSQVYAVSPERDITREVIEEIRKRNTTESTSLLAPADGGIRVAEMPGGGEFLPR